MHALSHHRITSAALLCCAVLVGSACSSSGSDAANQLPSASNLAPAGAGTQFFDVPFTVDVQDVNGDTVTITVQYSLNGGVSWSNASIEEPLGSRSPGTGIALTWESFDDIGEQASAISVRLRVRGSDGEGPGTWTQSSSFQLKSDVIYVDQAATGADDGSSWTDAYPSLATALGAAAIGAEVWVADGSYEPTTGTLRTASFTLLSQMALRGGFAGSESHPSLRAVSSDDGLLDVNETILSGDIGTDADASDNSHTVLTGADDGVIDGLTITLGNADGGGGGAQDNGGGLYVTGSDISIDRCRFSSNSASASGGAAFISGGSTARISRSVFVGSSADNAAIFVSGTTTTELLSSRFLGNDGSGVAGAASALQFVNTAASVGQCEFSGNTTRPAVVSTFGTASIASSSFANNAVFDVEGRGGVITIVNSILWSAGGGSIEDDGDISVSFSDVRGSGGSGAGWTFSNVVDDGGNIDGDPLFNDADGTDDTLGNEDDDLRIKTNSPAIDVGEVASLPADLVDIDNDGDRDEAVPEDLTGMDRQVDDGTTTDGASAGSPPVDMGAHEWPVGGPT